MGKVLVAELLDALESIYGRQRAEWPVDPYEFLVWWHCGYPPSEERCGRGWEKLRSEIGVAPEKLLKAAPRKLAAALKAGGMVPELRAERLREIAGRVRDEFGGDLRGALVGPEARKILKTFPGMGDPGADRILLFAGIEAVAAVPSNSPYVLVRVLDGRESDDYTANYRAAQKAIAAGVAATVTARARAYLLLKRHGQELCKRSKPRCGECGVRKDCRFQIADCRSET